MNDPKPASEEIPAATQVIFRKNPAGGAPQLLMVTRSKSLRFAGGAAVFPGGRVDPQDRALAQSGAFGLPSASDEAPGDAIEEAAHRIAAIRETLEETGLAIAMHCAPSAANNGGTAQKRAINSADAIKARQIVKAQGALAPVLQAMGWTLDLSALIPFARWNPKNERLSRTFDTRFYLSDLGTGNVDIAVDETENTRAFWSTAQETLDLADAQELSIIYPTRRNLERLALFSDFAAAADHCAQTPVKTVVPFMETRGKAGGKAGGDGEEEGGEESWLCIRDDAGYPVTGEPLSGAMRGH